MKVPAHHVSVRLDDALIARIDALVPHLSKDRRATRSDALRLVLLTALDKAEKDPEQFEAQFRAER